MKSDSTPKRREYAALCYWDHLPCDRFIEKSGLSACYVKDSEARLTFVCPRYVAKGSVSEDWVHEKLIPK